jgi:lauroyl/myristoyl acyltransferase
MNSSLLRFLQKTPGLPPLLRRLPPIAYFRASVWYVGLASWLSPIQMRRSRHFSEVVRASFAEKELRARARSYLLNSRLSKDFEITWRNWRHRHADWIAIEGESHLQDALRQGKGVFLISPHNFGFSKLVAPTLAARGYRVHRGGNGGKRGARKRGRWGKDFQFNWGYLAYKGDYWHRAQLLRAMQNVLAANEIVHVSPRALRQGEEEMAIDIFGRKFFLDPIWFRVFQLCEAPVLPCFVLGKPEVPINIIIHPQLPSGKSTAKAFAAMQTCYINKFPEYGRMWKNIRLEKERW